jgi:ketosteroid isomerase-like protein
MSTEVTKSVLDHHMAALLADDLDEVMTDYTEDSVFITNLGGVIKGLEGIRGVFGASGAAMAGFEGAVEEVDDDVAFVVWKSDLMPFGTDTFVVRDGKIAVQTVALHLG